SVAMISGYASDTSGQLGYMYHRADSSIAGTLESGKFKVKSGVVTKVQMSSFGSGYSTAPLVSYAGGDGAFKANAVLAKTGSITNVTIVDGGSQYTKAPTVVAEGKGFGFVGKTILTSTGSFSAISLDNAGQGYITVPTVTPTGGGTGFLAEAVLEGSGSLKSVTIDKAGTGYAIGDELPVSGDGTGTIVKVSDVDAGGAILSVNILSKGSGYTDMGIDGTTTGGKNAAFTAIIGYKLKEIRLLNSGSGYVSGNLSITGGSADSAAVASGTLVYSIASVTITSGGYGYVSPSIVFTGDGVDAYAYATVKYGVDYVLVQNGGTNYTNGSLTFTSLDTGSGAAANAIVFDGAEFAATDALNYKLALFGEGYVYDATGFFDFTHVNATDNYELVLENQFDGVKTENLGFAIGNNYRQDPCKSGQEWVSVASFPNGSTFNSIGIAEVEISYDYYLAAKDVVIMANLVGQQNSIDQKVRFGEAIKHTFRGSGLVATSSSFNKGASYETHRLYITWNDTVEPLRNSRFTYTVKVVADGAVVHQIQDSMSFGIEECGVDSNGVKLEGRAYVDITISSPTSGGTISLENLLLVREFN
ncbi:hypothetical protein KKC15_04410, partial [bacterium]|nr:hypothetical protein [bacterium]